MLRNNAVAEFASTRRAARVGIIRNNNAHLTLSQGQACNERGEGVEGPTKWKVRLDMEGRVTGIAGISFPRIENYERQTGVKTNYLFTYEQ